VASKSAPAAAARGLQLPSGETTWDVTYPDGSHVPVNQRFVKTWRLRNAGTVAWHGRFLQRLPPFDGLDVVVTGEQARAHALHPDFEVRRGVGGPLDGADPGLPAADALPRVGVGGLAHPRLHARGRRCGRSVARRRETGRDGECPGIVFAHQDNAVFGEGRPG
jgi:hypothetical protein